VFHAEFLSADVKLFGKKAGKPAAPQPSPAEQVAQQAAAEAMLANGAAPLSEDQSLSSNDKKVKLNYFSKSWGDVMRDVAQQSGRPLVMDKVPPGRFSRSDWTKYSVNDAVKILNRELEPKGFRILERGPYLDLVFLRDARSEYARPIVSAAAPAIAEADSSGTGEAIPRRLPKETADAPSKAASPKRNSMILQVAHDEMDEDDGKEEDLEIAESPRRWVAVTLKHQSARNVSRSLYQAFEQDAELIDQ
jgi:hypothetical protein